MKIDFSFKTKIRIPEDRKEWAYRNCKIPADTPIESLTQQQAVKLIQLAYYENWYDCAQDELWNIDPERVTDYKVSE